jgi:hypothetical protein
LEVILVTNCDTSFHQYLFLEHNKCQTDTQVRCTFQTLFFGFYLQDVTLKYIEIKSSTSEHPTDAAHGSHAPAVASQVPTVQIEPAVATIASESGSGVRTADSSSAEKLTAQENSNSVSKPIQNPELETAASSSAETMTGRQEKERNDAEEVKRGRMVEKQTNSDAQKQDGAREPTTPDGVAAAVTEEGDNTGPTEDGKEDKRSRESSLERVII